MSRYIDADIIKYTEPLTITRKDSRSLQKTVLNFALQYAKEAVDAIPTADVKPVVHAHMVEYAPHLYECSNCGFNMMENFFNYCPNCGAIMDEGVKDED